ncbi:MAG: GCN5-related N-acetyltransferase, partial [Myxococcales bacterium]|nr:GCN5-related N-acetyltransferase [Myxococcales bacterium]
MPEMDDGTRDQADETLIRAAEPRDLAAVVALVRGLAEFEKLPGPDAAAEARFVADLGTHYQLYVAETRGTIIGYALYFFTYSTFLAQPSLYLEDLYVEPSARGRG